MRSMPLSFDVDTCNFSPDFFFFAGVRTADGKDIICMDTDKLPKKEHFKNKKEFKQAVREFIS